MKTVNKLRLYWMIALVEGLAVTGALLLGTGGRPASLPVRFGLPLMAVGICFALAGFGGWLVSSPDRARIFSQRAGGWIRRGR